MKTEKKTKKKTEKKTEKKKKLSLAKKILVNILNSAADFSNEMDDMYKYGVSSVVGSSGRIAEIERARERKYFKEELVRLKRKKLIEERKRGDQLELCLTEEGKNLALRQQILYSNNIVKDKYYLVIFDVPESERKTRDFFRSFLKEADFIQLQQSVWLTQKDIEEYLVELIRVAGAEKWIYVVTATKINDFSFEKFEKDKKKQKKLIEKEQKIVEKIESI